MKSLFIVALPRSLSTVLYHVACEALCLQAPGWVSAGEVLNADRHLLSPVDHGHRGVKYLTETQDPAGFAAARAYLGTVTRAENHAYKDVVNPFVVAGWAGLADFKVLRIRRDVAEVGLAMMLQGWDYPKAAVPPQGSLRRLGGWDRTALTPWLTDPLWVRRQMAGYPVNTVLLGLVRAEAALSALTGEVVDFDACINDTRAFGAALERLYPGVSLPRLTYLDETFRSGRDVQLRRRQTPAYREIRRRVERMQKAESLGRASPGPFSAIADGP